MIIGIPREIKHSEHRVALSPSAAEVLAGDGHTVVIHATSHSQPTYTTHGIVHYGVTNMPGAVPRTSTIALCNASLPYIRQLAIEGFVQAVRNSTALAAGVNTYRGSVTQRKVAEALNRDYVPLDPATKPAPASL